MTIAANRPSGKSSANRKDRYEALPPLDKAVLRLKALLGLPTNKTIFVTAMARTGQRTAEGKATSAATLNPVLERLAAMGLLTEDLACHPDLLHEVAADAMDSPDREALLQAALAVTEGSGSGYYGYSMQTDESALRRLRLAIYANDADTYRAKLALYDQSYRPERGPHLLDRFFLDTPVSVEWLESRDLDIQYGIFATKFAASLQSGIPAPDLLPLIEHYRRRQDEPGYERFKWDMLGYDVLAGALALARRKIDAIEDDRIYVGKAFEGALAFLSGRNEEALDRYREALRLYRKDIGKRKVFLNGYHGILFLLAMLRQNDPALYPEMQGALDGVTTQHPGNPYGGGFLALQAVLWLLQGFDAKAGEMLSMLRAAMPGEPLSAACVALAEYVLDTDRARRHRADTAARFDRLKEVMPLVAGIHAEVLARVADHPAPYEAFLRRPEREEAIAFADLVQVKQPWERALDNLESFLGTAPARPAANGAPRKSRRLVWFLDPDSKAVEVAEQSAKGQNGWSGGRAVAMKRLYEQDPRLDYLTDQDRRALRTIRKETYGWYDDVSYAFDPYRTVLALIGHPLVFDARNRDRPIELVSYPLELVVTETGRGYRIALSHGADEPTAFLEQETPTRYRVIDVSARMVALHEILGPRGLTIPKSGKDKVIALARRANPAIPIRSDIAAVDLPAVEGVATPVLRLVPLDEGLRVTAMVRPFGEEGPHYIAGQGGRSVLAVIQGRQLRANRDLDRERQALAAVVASCPVLREQDAAGHEWVVGDTESCLELLTAIAACPEPVAVEWPEGRKLSVTPPVGAEKLSVKLSRSRNWFQLTGDVAVDEEQVLEMQFLLDRLDRAAGRFIPLDDGRFLALTAQFQKQLERLRGLGEADGQRTRVPALGAPALRDLLDGAGKVEADRHWQDLVARIDAAERHQPRVPSTLQAELRDYQVEGFCWLSRLAHWGAGACLADDMGLGKTVQSLAVMLERAPNGPILVIAPTSVCHNWEAEIARFAPTLTAHRLSAAADRAALVGGLGPMEVLIASYGLLHQEAELLAGKAWDMVVFDEAQAIKNAATKRAQASGKLQAGFRLALTGTPIENYLGELWSLFNVINPGLVGSLESFQKRFAVPIERERDGAARQALKTLIRPFILRRTKAAVLSELPARTEQTILVELEEDERAFYEALRLKAIETIAALSEEDAGRRKIHILAEINRLRRACCHPSLVQPEIGLGSSKHRLFLELVEELVRNHHKALVFSQYVGHLELVRRALDAAGVSYQYLDGSTPSRDRERRVAAFQAGEGDLFLISLRAGGVGLNLTAADYVIHLDPWWNPAVEDQASDRAHRIGQQRPVTIYRLITEATIEERIVRLHQDKRDLAADVLDGAEVAGRMTDDELLALIKA